MQRVVVCIFGRFVISLRRDSVTTPSAAICIRSPMADGEGERLCGWVAGGWVEAGA